jgi:hypothetical protein
MSTNAHQPEDRLPTAGPDTEAYGRYELEWANASEALIYNKNEKEEWIRSEVVLSLDTWR